MNDAQADYYESSTWLSEEEKQSLDDKERQRREASRPSNRKCKISFDIAGRKVVEEVADDDDDDDDDGDDSHNGESHEKDLSYLDTPVVENTSLMNQEGRMGDVYRQIRNSLADRRAAATATAAVTTGHGPV